MTANHDNEETNGRKSVVIGPDLNPSRTPLDRKQYRQIILPNGLRAVLVSDTLAIHQSHNAGIDYEGYNHDESDGHESSDGEDDDEDSGFSDDEDCGLRDAAAAMVVGVGSMYDPEDCQGMAHFLEHLLFMGSEKYPEENAYDGFLSKHGGDDNAYTELEHTVYHFEIAQEYLFEALDMFAQFFIHPLMLEDAVERELQSIESEFQLVKNSDSSRLQQLMFHTCGRTSAQHPFAKFHWGNIKSLKEIPARRGINVMEKLRTFYDQYYYAGNMSLAVIGAYSLDTLQKKVLNCFKPVPPLPRVPAPPSLSSPLSISKYGLPFSKESLQRIYRIVPVKDRHTLHITWQILSQFPHWRSKPADYLAHLLGHEARGSLLSSLKHQNWATGCFAGVGSDGYENASSHALFTLTLSLSEGGVAVWPQVVLEVYKYIGMLRHTPVLPEWIFEELRSNNDVSYRYSDEQSPDSLVEELAEEMAPRHPQLPPDRLLDGRALLFEDDPDAVKDLLDNFFTPSNARLDLMSSTVGRTVDYEEAPEGCDDMTGTTVVELNVLEWSDTFDPEKAGPPQIEPMFGTQFWCQALPAELIKQWSDAASPQDPPPGSMLSLPPRNPFVPTIFDLKPVPPGDSHHPLLNCSLKVCLLVGKKKSWYAATVIRYNRTDNKILLSYEDENEQWHQMDLQPSELSPIELVAGFEGTLDQKKTKFRILAMAAGKGAVRKFGDDSDHGVADGIAFPPIPPPLSENRLPKLVVNTQVLKLWHLQDRVFGRPIADLRLRIYSREANKSALHRACAELLVLLCIDATTEISYLADVCELTSVLEASGIGFDLRVHGFDHKLLDLFHLVLEQLLRFRGREEEAGLPESVKEGRFEACLEILQRKYENSGLKSSALASSVRLACLLPSTWSTHQKAVALKGIDIPVFTATVSSILGQIGMEGIFHGNVDRPEAEKARDIVFNLIEETGGGSLPRKKYPSQLVQKIPLSTEAKVVTLPSKDPSEPNTAVEIYIQIGKDDVEHRTIIDVLVQMMYEPLYDQIRTKDQFGYFVGCDARWTSGVLGMQFQVVTATKTAAEATERLELFIQSFRQEIVDMTSDDFKEHLIALSKQKLGMFDSLSDETDCYWDEIRDGRFEWQVHRNEVICLFGVTKERVLELYDEWFSQKRRMVVIQVVGSIDGPSGRGRPEVGADSDATGEFIDSAVADMRQYCKQQTWGKIYR